MSLKYLETTGKYVAADYPALLLMINTCVRISEHKWQKIYARVIKSNMSFSQDTTGEQSNGYYNETSQMIPYNWTIIFGVTRSLRFCVRVCKQGII